VKLQVLEYHHDSNGGFTANLAINSDSNTPIYQAHCKLSDSESCARFIEKAIQLEPSLDQKTLEAKLKDLLTEVTVLTEKERQTSTRQEPSEAAKFIIQQIIAGRTQEEIANLLPDFCRNNGSNDTEVLQELATLWEKRTQPEITEEAVENGEVRLKHYNSMPPRYELYWDYIGGTIPINLSNMDELWSWTTVNKRMAERWRIVASDMKPKEWHELLGKLIANAEVIEQPGASDAAAVLDILDNWFENEGISRWSKADLFSRPLYRDGYYYFRVEVFEERALFAQNSRFFYQRYLMQRPSLWAILSGAGAVSKTENFRGKKIRVWKIAANFNESTEAAANELEDEYNDDDPRIQLLRMGSKLNYPKLELSQGHYIDSAEAN
jgi:hypothetical protein